MKVERTEKVIKNKKNKYEDYWKYDIWIEIIILYYKDK